MKAILQYMKPMLSTKKTHPTKGEDKEQYILLTYRSGITKSLPTTYYDSDAGWGCMLRVGQMFLANLYFKVEERPREEVIQLCYDNEPIMPFSLQRITEAAKELYGEKKNYEWFSPCQCGFIIKHLLDKFDNDYRVSICNNNCIFLDEIETDRERLVVLVMCRIGLDEPELPYLKCLLSFMKNPYFNSILGGTPKRAHIFYKHEEGHLGFLDPHQTRKVPNFHDLPKKESQFISKLLWIKEDQIDCSMAVSFIVPRTHLASFWETLELSKEQFGESFFIYLSKEKPVYDEDDECGIIEILEEQDDF